MSTVYTHTKYIQCISNVNYDYKLYILYTSIFQINIFLLIAIYFSDVRAYKYRVRVFIAATNLRVTKAQVMEVLRDVSSAWLSPFRP